MMALLRVLLRAVTAAFYRRYAGWLIGVGLLLGGVLSSNEHTTLIREALRDWRVLVGVYLMPWTAYTLLSARFAGRLWALPEYEPLLVLRLVPPAQRWTAGLLTQLAMLAPCWLYGTVMLVFAGQARAFGPGLAVAGTLAALTVSGWGAHEAALRGSRPGGRWALGWRWPPALWGLRAEWHARPLGTLLTKAASVGVIVLLSRLYDPATFDARILALGALLTAAFAARLPAELVYWERTRLAFRGNLPVSLARRWGQKLAQYAVWLVLEAVAWALCCPLPGAARWAWAGSLTAFPLAALLLADAALLRWPRAPADAVAPMAGALFGGYLLLLLGVPLAALTVGAGLGSIWLTVRFGWNAVDAPE